ncbi:MAG TPA: site-specific integrase [Rhizomicrobium sp.]|jgi:integrase
MDGFLYDGRGRRKYLLPIERRAFLKAALEVGGQTASFCAVLVLCGPRISEALALTPERIDDATGTITFETLKRRRKGTMRAVPAPVELLLFLDNVHHYREAQTNSSLASTRLWRWSRTTAWRRVKETMRLAKCPAFVSKPKSLRHAFGIAAVSRDVTLTMVKKWMGHARIQTTEIYTQLVGDEEQALAQRTWRELLPML